MDDNFERTFNVVFLITGLFGVALTIVLIWGIVTLVLHFTGGK